MIAALYVVALLLLVVILLTLRHLAIGSKRALFDGYTIDVGDHYSYRTTDPLRWRLKVSPTTKRWLKFKAIFGLGCNYKQLPSHDDMDVSKLYGLQFGRSPLRASARIGWRWDRLSSHVVVYGYVHDGESRHIVELGRTTIGTSIECEIIVNSHNVYFYFNHHGNKNSSHVELAHVRPWPLKFRLFPYFGGNQVAPNMMSLFIKEHR